MAENERLIKVKINQGLLFVTIKARDQQDFRKIEATIQDQLERHPQFVAMPEAWLVKVDYFYKIEPIEPEKPEEVK